MDNLLMELLLAVINLVSLAIILRFLNGIFIKSNVNKKIKYSIYVVILFLHTLGNILTHGLKESLILGFFAYLIVTLTLYDAKFYMKFIVTIFFVTFSFVGELIAILLMSFVFGDIILDIRENTMYLFLGSVLSRIVLIIIVDLIIRYKSSKKSKVSISSWGLIFSIPLISIVLLIISVYNPIVINKYSEGAVIACFAILYINVVTFYLFDNIIKQVNENNEYRFRENMLNQQQEHYKSVIDGYEQVKKVKHDMIGHLITLDGYIKRKENDKALTYIHQLNDSLDFSQSVILSNNAVVDALVYNRMTLTTQNNITFEKEITVPSEFKINDMDLSIVLGNIVNNAIEACSMLPDKKERFISLKMKYKNNALFIELKNTYILNKVKVKDGKYISSKPSRKDKSFGMGISNVKEIVDLYNGFFQIELEKESFLVKVMIPDRLIMERK